MTKAVFNRNICFIKAGLLWWVLGPFSLICKSHGSICHTLPHNFRVKVNKYWNFYLYSNLYSEKLLLPLTENQIFFYPDPFYKNGSSLIRIFLWQTLAKRLSVFCTGPWRRWWRRILRPLPMILPMGREHSFLILSFYFSLSISVLLCLSLAFSGFPCLSLSFSVFLCHRIVPITIWLPDRRLP